MGKIETPTAEDRKAGFEAWKRGLFEAQRRRTVPSPAKLGLKKSPIYVFSCKTGELFEILDEETHGDCRGGGFYDPPCGGCAGCLYLQMLHANDPKRELTLEERKKGPYWECLTWEEIMG
jgi:hypothetical protein